MQFTRSLLAALIIAVSIGLTGCETSAPRGSTVTVPATTSSTPDGGYNTFDGQLNIDGSRNADNDPYPDVDD